MVEAQSQLNFSELSLPDKRYYTKGLNRFSNSHLVGASFSIILSITSKFWIVTHLALMRKLKQNHQKILWRRANARNVIRKYCSITSIWMLHPQWITFMDMVFSCGGVSDGNSLLISLFFFFQFQQIHTVEDVKISTMFLTRLSSYLQVENSTRITTRNITRAELQSRQRRRKLNL